MSSPTFDEATIQWARYNDLLDETEKWAATYVAAEDTLIQLAESDYAAGILAGLEVQRGYIANVLSPGNIRQNYAWYLQTIAKAISSTALDIPGIWRDLYDYFFENAKYVNSREFSFGSASAGGSNTGTGSVLRCTNDDRGMTMEGWHADTYTLTCKADARQLGVDFESEWLVEGTTKTKDELARTGSGVVDRIKAISERTSEQFLLNPGFETYSGTTPTAGNEQTPTAVSGWTPASGVYTNLRVSVDTVYRTPPGGSTSISLKMVDNESISQNLVSVNGTRLDADTPYHVRVFVYRDTNCDGNLTITLGGVTRTIAMSTLNNGAWNAVDLVATPGRNSWYEQIKTNSLTFTIALASRTTGYAYFDSVVFGPFTLIGGNGTTGRGCMGTYLAIIESATAFVVNDKFTIADTVGATRGVNQYWPAVAEVGYLPSTAAAYETLADY